MPRSYGQFCGLAAALDVLGERWTLLVIREVLTGPKRFNELLTALDGIGPNLLAKRLHRLTEEGFLIHESLGDRDRGVRYRLSPEGEALRPTVLSLASWGLRNMAVHVNKGRVSPHWGILAVEAMAADHLELARVDETYQFQIDDVSFVLEVKPGAVLVSEGTAAEPVLTVSADAETFVRIGARVLSPFAAVAQGRITVDGDPEALERCAELLGLDLYHSAPVST
jgi:DNA-binding HxlR family transcriptional regulator